jgi:hypothetical protein
MGGEPLVEPGVWRPEMWAIRFIWRWYEKYGKNYCDKSGVAGTRIFTAGAASTCTACTKITILLFVKKKNKSLAPHNFSLLEPHKHDAAPRKKKQDYRCDIFKHSLLATQPIFET